MQRVMGMLSPEQQEMFEMYQTMFSQPEEHAAAGSPPGSAAPSESGSFGQASPEVQIQEDGQQEPDLNGFSLRDTDLSERGSYYDMQK